jgi:hypothetical protein
VESRYATDDGAKQFEEGVIRKRVRICRQVLEQISERDTCFGGLRHVTSPATHAPVPPVSNVVELGGFLTSFC